MQPFWHFMAIYGILAFLPKSRIGNQIRFFQFYPIFRLFPTSRLSDSTALIRPRSRKQHSLTSGPSDQEVVDDGHDSDDGDGLDEMNTSESAIGVRKGEEELI